MDAREFILSLPKKIVLPPATEGQRQQAVAQLGRPLPPELDSLLAVTAGLDLDYPISLCAALGGQDLSNLSPHAIPLWEDGFGNSWNLDCDAPPSDAYLIVFACHDPPVVMFQCSTLTEFLAFAWKLHKGEGPEAQLHDDRLQALAEAGCVICRGVRSVATGHQQLRCDLTNASPGDGFWWAAPGGDFAARRIESGPVFEVWRDE